MTLFNKFNEEAKAKVSALGSSSAALRAKVTQLAAESASAANASLGSGMKSASKTVGNLSSALASGATKSGVTAKESVQKSGRAIASGCGAVRQQAASVAGRLGDQNGDGKFDQEDLRILADKTKASVAGAATKAAVVGKQFVESELAREIASNAAKGGAQGVFGGPHAAVIGALSGAALGAVSVGFKTFTKK